MGYYIRVLATDGTPLAEEALRQCLPTYPPTELVVESNDEGGWTQLILSHANGPEIAAIERNPVLAGQLGEAEIAEFVEEAIVSKPDSAGRWLEQFLPRVKVIYAFQLLSGTEIKDGWAAVHALRTYVWQRRGGIFQADGEGLSNEEGYHILWQFSNNADGSWNMATLNPSGQWTRFEMNLGDREQRAAFLEGRVPRGVKLL